MKIQELREYYLSFQLKGAGEGIPEFIEYVRNEQIARPKGGIVSREERDTHRRLKEREARQAAERLPDPDTDFDNL